MSHSYMTGIWYCTHIYTSNVNAVWGLAYSNPYQAKPFWSCALGQQTICRAEIVLYIIPNDLDFRLLISNHWYYADDTGYYADDTGLRWQSFESCGYHLYQLWLRLYAVARASQHWVSCLYNDQKNVIGVTASRPLIWASIPGLFF